MTRKAVGQHEPDRPVTITGFCTNRMIRYESEGRAYLLKKMRMSGEHVELFSYHLFVSVLWPRDQNKEFEPFSGLEYFSQNTDSAEPYARLVWKHDEGSIALELKGDLIRRLDFVETNGRLAKNADMDIVEAAIDEVIEVVKGFENSKAQRVK